MARLFPECTVQSVPKSIKIISLEAEEESGRGGINKNEYAIVFCFGYYFFGFTYRASAVVPETMKTRKAN